MKVLGVDAEEHRANGHAGSLIILLRISVDRNGLGIDPLEVMANSLLRQAFGHALEQAVAAVTWETTASPRSATWVPGPRSRAR
jgi:hypothetical protein